MKSTQIAETPIQFASILQSAEDERRRQLNKQDKGEQCVFCGKDSWTCEHFDPREEALNNQ